MSRTLAGLLLLVATACRAKEPVVMSPPPGGPVAAPDPAGYWSGDWGRLVIEHDGRAVYDHDDGTIVGAMRGDTLVGGWCEGPSRQSTADAGDVELRFVTAPDGTRSIDGRWRYGTDEAWRDDWDLGWDPGTPPADLVARFSDPAAFCAHP